MIRKLEDRLRLSMCVVADRMQSIDAEDSHTLSKALGNMAWVLDNVSKTNNARENHDIELQKQISEIHYKTSKREIDLLEAENLVERNRAKLKEEELRFGKIGSGKEVDYEEIRRAIEGK